MRGREPASGAGRPRRGPGTAAKLRERAAATAPGTRGLGTRRGPRRLPARRQRRPGTLAGERLGRAIARRPRRHRRSGLAVQTVGQAGAGRGGPGWPNGPGISGGRCARWGLRGKDPGRPRGVEWGKGGHRVPVAAGAATHPLRRRALPPAARGRWRPRGRGGGGRGGGARRASALLPRLGAPRPAPPR